jgi:hypothetical protein
MKQFERQYYIDEQEIDQRIDELKVSFVEANSIIEEEGIEQQIAALEIRKNELYNLAFKVD